MVGQEDIGDGLDGRDVRGAMHSAAVLELLQSFDSPNVR